VYKPRRDLWGYNLNKSNKEIASFSSFEERFAILESGMGSSEFRLKDRKCGCSLKLDVDNLFLVLDQVKFILSSKVSYKTYLVGFGKDSVGKLTIDFILSKYNTRFIRTGNTERNNTLFWQYFVGVLDLDGYRKAAGVDA
jgi:hypothetical protein